MSERKTAVSIIASGFIVLLAVLMASRFPVAASNVKDVNIRFQDSSDIDSYGRLRVSSPVTVFSTEQSNDSSALFWDEALESGAGIFSSHSVDNALTTITSTANTAGTFTRQTFVRFHSQPGAAHQIMLACVLDKDGGGTGVLRRAGLFDDENGFFFEFKEGISSIVVRTHITGVTIESIITQPNWNIDPMDGTGPSAFTIDWSTTQLLYIDYQGVLTGRIRFGLVLEGQIFMVHQVLNSNNLDTSHLSSDNLPLRYQLVTTASSPESSISIISSLVQIEGLGANLGLVHHAGTAGVHVDADITNTIYAILGLRLKPTALGTSVFMQRAEIQIQTGSEIGHWFLLFNPTVAGTFTYIDQPNSATQVAGGATANTVTGGVMIDGGFAQSSSGGNGSGGTSAIIENALRLGSAINGTLDTIVLCWQPTAGTNNHDIEGALTWRELP